VSGRRPEPDVSVEQLVQHAMGLAEGMSKSEDAVGELIELAGGRRNVLEEARDRAEQEGRAIAARDTPVTPESDMEIPEATALLAGRLLAEAAESCDR
jgi:hypothetical protein